MNGTTADIKITLPIMDRILLTIETQNERSCSGQANTDRPRKCALERNARRVSPAGSDYRIATIAIIAMTASRNLVDPYSARFEGLRVVNNSDCPLVCGEVNSKNRMGGYVGALPFVYMETNGSAYIVKDQADLSDMLQMSEFTNELKACYPEMLPMEDYRRPLLKYRRR